MKTPLIIETDIGRDPDDLFAILYLIATEKYNIKAICITPGDWDQICLVECIRQICHLNYEIGVPEATYSGKRQNKTSSGGIHYALMNALHWPITEMLGVAKTGYEVIYHNYTDTTQFFSIGPLTNIGEYIQQLAHTNLSNPITIQGGFCPYTIYSPKIRLNKFENKISIQTFNLNGDIQNALLVTNTYRNAQFVGKNVCHTIEFTKDKTPPLKEVPRGMECYHPASYLFEKAAELYFKKHSVKKFHDPTAAIAMLHPEIGIWIDACPQLIDKKQWTTNLNPIYNSSVLVDIDRNKLWEHLMNYN